MRTQNLPFVFHASHEARREIGAHLEEAAGQALRTLLKGRGTLEIAHQQFRFKGKQIAFSSKIGSEGDLIMILDLGDPRLADRVIPESALSKRRK